MSQEKLITGLLAEAGVTVNGPNPWDIQIKNPQLWDRIFAYGSLGLGEAYMDGWWEAEDLAEFFNRVVGANIGKKLRVTPNLVWQHFQARYLNMQTITRSQRVAKMHYNETDAYKATLDRRMVGSCAYFNDTDDLDIAQEKKLDMICRKVQLKPSERVLDIGCGWGGFMGFAAEKYGADCVGVTVSPDQAAYARARYEGLKVDFQVKDYRLFEGKVDKIVSMGMFEHVGYRNFRAYFEVARRAIAEDGLFMLHTIGSPVTTTTIEPWIEKYIFPGGVLPSLKQVGEAIEGLFSVIDLHNIGPHYDKTLVAWWENFRAKWPEPKTEEDWRFYRMWKYYLLCCAGGFRSRAIHVWQFVLAPRGVPDGYVTQR